MRRMFFRKLAGAAVALLACTALSPVLADTYPSKPIRLIVPYSPGGLPDTVARALSVHLSKALGQTVFVENKPGAGGSISASVITQSPADGYNLLVTDGPLLTISPLINKSVTYNIQKDFAPVSLVGKAPLFLAVNAGVPAKTLDEFIALAKAKPGKLNYGSSGIGGIHHLTAEAMKDALGLEITHIPFKGSGNSVPAMIGGEVDMVFASPPSLMGFVKSDKAKLIAINSLKRSPLAPDVPALAEKAPGFDFAFNVAVLARAGTPKNITDRIAAEIAKIVKQPEVIEQLQAAGVDPVGGSAEQLASALKSEGDRLTTAAKRANLKPE